jgi:hypothetical protein
MPNDPNTAGGDLRKRALELYAKAKAIRYNNPMGAATQPSAHVITTHSA